MNTADAGLTALLLGLASNESAGAARGQARGVARLKLRDNGIEDEGAAALAEFLLHAPSVVEVDLRDNAVGALGARELAYALSVSGTIRKFDIRAQRGRGIDDEGSLAITSALQHNPRLRKHPCKVEYD